jgi:hypothetical protein
MASPRKASSAEARASFPAPRCWKLNPPLNFLAIGDLLEKNS